jgi:putative transposase
MPPDPPELRFYSPWMESRRARNRLPHLQQPEATYFVTFRLADSLPMMVQNLWQAQIAAWLKWHPKPWSDQVEQEYYRLYSMEIEGWLDKGCGSCLLRSAEYSAVLSETLMQENGKAVEQHAFVIMPNHIHVLFSPCDGAEVSRLVKAWKGTSARRINQLAGEAGTLWQKDYLDRMIRDDEHFWRCVRYIRSNPTRANLQRAEFVHYEAA